MELGKGAGVAALGRVGLLSTQALPLTPCFSVLCYSPCSRPRGRGGGCHPEALQWGVMSSDGFAGRSLRRAWGWESGTMQTNEGDPSGGSGDKLHRPSLAGSAWLAVGWAGEGGPESSGCSEQL